MNNIFLLLTLSILSAQAHASTDELSVECKSQLKTNILEQATAVLGSMVTADSVDINIFLNSKKNKLRLSVTHNKDGAQLEFEATAKDADIVSCNITPVLNLELSCRYSNYGEVAFDKIENMIVEYKYTFSDDKNLTPIQVDQVKKLLIYDDETTPLNDMIADTDDGEVSYSVVTLPDGQKLDYYRTYGGDNAYGAFYYEGTADLAGSNGDDSICIGFPVK
jgi:hypothetical protein